MPANQAKLPSTLTTQPPESEEDATLLRQYLEQYLEQHLEQHLQEHLEQHLRRRLPSLVRLLLIHGYNAAHGILITHGGDVPGWRLANPGKRETFFQGLNRQMLSMAGIRQALPFDDRVRQWC